jgi:hypothetical protein
MQYKKPKTINSMVLGFSSVGQQGLIDFNALSPAVKAHSLITYEIVLRAFIYRVFTYFLVHPGFL